MKKLIRTGIAGLLALSLCGCSAMVQIAKIPGGDRGGTEGNGSIFTEPEQNDTGGDVAGGGDVGAGAVPMPQETKESGIANPYLFYNGYYTADSSHVYMTERGNVYAIDRKTNAMQLLTRLEEKTGDESSPPFFGWDHALTLYGDFLYCLGTENRTDTEDEQPFCLIWKIHKETGEKKLLRIPLTEGRHVRDLYIVEDRIYIPVWGDWDTPDGDEAYGSYRDGTEIFELTPDGDPGQRVTGDAKDPYRGIPKEYGDPYMAGVSGNIYLPWQQQWTETCLLMNRDDYSIVTFNLQTGEIQPLLEKGYTLDYYDGEHMLYHSYDYGYNVETDDYTGTATVLYRNMQTGEQYEVSENVYQLLGADATGVYYYEYDMDYTVSPEQMDICYLPFDEMKEGAAGRLLFTVEKSSKFHGSCQTVENSFAVFDQGELYFADCEGDELNLVHYPFQQGAETFEICGLLKESGLRNVGEYTLLDRLVRCDRCGRIIGEYYSEGFKMDGTMPGDARIEEQLTMWRESGEEIFVDTYQGEECDYHTYVNSPNTRVRYIRVSYLDDDYIGFLQTGYDYWSGAAHGLQYQDFLLFDRKTGEEISVHDLLATSEEEFHNLVAERFEREYPGPDSELDLDYIREYAGYYEGDGFYIGDCYLDETGLVYYFYEYEVAAYASGMPGIRIPYEELEWKIPLKNRISY